MAAPPRAAAQRELSDDDAALLVSSDEEDHAAPKRRKAAADSGAPSQKCKLNMKSHHRSSTCLHLCSYSRAARVASSNYTCSRLPAQCPTSRSSARLAAAATHSTTAHAPPSVLRCSSGSGRTGATCPGARAAFVCMCCLCPPMPAAARPCVERERARVRGVGQRDHAAADSGRHRRQLLQQVDCAMALGRRAGRCLARGGEPGAAVPSTRRALIARRCGAGSGTTRAAADSWKVAVRAASLH